MEEITICEWFQYYSRAVWNKLLFAKMTGIKISEITITQNFVFEFWSLARLHRFPIDIYEAKDEKTNGNDLEILIETEKGYLLFPCQAKLVQKGNRYSTISHKVKSNFQIEILIQYAKRHGGIPLYLFYNYCTPSKQLEEIGSRISFPIEYYGMSLVKATYLIENHFSPEKFRCWKIPKFQDLHPTIAIPLHHLICPTMSERVIHGGIFDLQEPVRYYRRSEIEEHPFWKNLAPRPRIGYVVPDLENALTLTDAKINRFQPKFRLVFHQDERKRGIYFLG